MPTALLSVWDKTGLIDFARSLHEAGWRLIASGGTARSLSSAGLEAIPVETITGQAELLAGRVKTLHPAIHAGILARDNPEDRSQLAAHGWKPIDLVAVNLYPFEETADQGEVSFEEMIEMIDIGGVALLRAAAKNFERVTALCDPQDYTEALNPADPAEFRQRMARKSFAHTSAYDSAIQRYFTGLEGESPPLEKKYYPSLELRYGENPHQKGMYYSQRPGEGPLGGQLLQGKRLSYNNLLDLDAAWRAVELFAKPAVVVVKHLSPCGIAQADSLSLALPPAIASDPTSAFGSVIAANREISLDFVEALGDLFVECLIAPSFSLEVRSSLETRQNLRLVQVSVGAIRELHEYRSIRGGMLSQSIDFGDPAEMNWNLVTNRAPTEDEMAALHFAWRAVQPVKSNAVLFARSDSGVQATVGIGGSQPNRVDCVHLAANRAGPRSIGAVMASDAFFPFPDGIEAAASYGIQAVVQPGGSIRDDQVIAAANEAGLAMVFTGIRHFRH